MTTDLPLLQPRQINQEAPHQQPQLSCWQRWRGRVVKILPWGLPTVSSVVARCLNVSNWLNGLSSFGVGFSVKRLVDSYFSTQDLLSFDRVSSTVFGQSSEFPLTMGFDNTDSVSIKALCSALIIVSLGINTAIYVRKLQRDRGVQLDHTYTSVSGEQPVTLKHIFLSRWPVHGLRLVAGIAFGIPAFFLEDPELAAVAGEFSLFFVGQAIGDETMWWINIKISSSEAEEEGSLAGTLYNIKKGLLTAYYFGIPFFLIPKSPSARAQFWEAILSGFPIGFLDGLSHRALEDRAVNRPVLEQTELQLHRPVENLAFRVWFVAYPFLVVAAHGGLLAWQLGAFGASKWTLTDRVEKDALITMVISFTGTLGVGILVDRSWKVEDVSSHSSFRRKLFDKTFYSLIISQRILGVHPAIPFSIVTNALDMSDTGISEASDLKRGVILVVWGLYGVAQALELIRTWGRRRGPETQVVMMIYINGGLVMKRVINGEIP